MSAAMMNGTVDITDAATRAATNSFFGGSTPVAVLCDNSRDAEMIPSDQSDFNRYGGLYRHVIWYMSRRFRWNASTSSPSSRRMAKRPVKLRARLYNPTSSKDAVELAIEIRDPQGNVLQNTTNELSSWSGEKEIIALEITKPQLWSPKTPALYQCAVTLESSQGEQAVTEKFGVRLLRMDRARAVQIEW